MTGETPLLCAAKQGHVEAIIRHKENARDWRSHFDTRDKEDIHESSSYVYFNFVLLFSTASHRQVAAPETVLTLCLLPWHRHLHPLSNYRHMLLSFRISGSEASSEQPGESRMEQIGLFTYLTGNCFIRPSCGRRSALILLIEMANISVNFHQILTRSATLSTF